jgi:hypothetical protein
MLTETVDKNVDNGRFGGNQHVIWCGIMGKLTHTGLKALMEKPGRHGDGQGLFFRTIGGGRAYWVFRYRADGKEREYSIGPYPEVSLNEARVKHATLRKRVVVDKADPLAERLAVKEAAREAPKTEKSFGEYADEYLDRQERRGLLGKNPMHRAQWRSTLASLPVSFRDLSVDQIGPSQVFHALDPILGPEARNRLTAQRPHRGGAGLCPRTRRRSTQSSGVVWLAEEPAWQPKAAWQDQPHDRGARPTRPPRCDALQGHPRLHG